MIQKDYGSLGLQPVERKESDFYLFLSTLKYETLHVVHISPNSPIYAAGHILHRFLYPMIIILQQILFFGFCFGRHLRSRHKFPMNESALTNTLSSVFPAVSIVCLHKIFLVPLTSYPSLWIAFLIKGGTKLHNLQLPNQFLFVLIHHSGSFIIKLL